LTASAVFFLFAAPSFAQVGALDGKVTGEDGQPAAGAVVKIQRSDIKGNWELKTNKKGEWMQMGLPAPATFSISVEVGGLVKDTNPNVRTTSRTTVSVDFDLAEAKKKNDVIQEAVASGNINLSASQTKGMSAEDKAALEEALKSRSESMKKNKALNDAFSQGMEALKAGQFQAAVDGLIKASEMDPKQDVVWGQLGEAYSQLGATKTGAEKDAAFAKAGEMYQKALELKPNDPAYHNNYALALARMGKVPEAQAELSKAAELDAPGAAKYYFNLGAVLMNTGQVDAAMEQFKKAISVDPKYAPAQYQLAMCLMGKATISADGNVVPPDGTRQALQQYLVLDPNGPYAGDAKAVLATLDQTIERNYSNPNSPKKAPAKKK
jgi:tetratricopeptide (TPR) repeat protein